MWSQKVPGFQGKKYMKSSPILTFQYMYIGQHFCEMPVEQAL